MTERSEEKMKNERFRMLIAILLVPVCLAGIVAFCKAEVWTAQENGTWKYDEWDELEDGEEVKTMEEQGYVVYQQFPERMKKLCEQELFHKADVQESRDEDSDEDEMSLEKMGSTEYLQSKRSQVVGVDDDAICMSAGLQFDPGSYCFVPEELAGIEACGFPGFAQKMQEIADMEKKNEEKYQETMWEDYGYCYHLYSQGVEFMVRRSGDTSFDLTAYIGIPTCYAPGKYQEFIQNVTESGEYFLYSTCVGGETDVITFCKNNSIFYASDVMEEDYRDKLNHKNITCLFRNGKLDDYYVAACGKKLELDEADRAFLDMYTKGLGKELSEKESMVSEWQGRYQIYRTE